jgi:hypothetical protein
MRLTTIALAVLPASYKGTEEQQKVADQYNAAANMAEAGNMQHVRRRATD